MIRLSDMPDPEAALRAANEAYFVGDMIDARGIVTRRIEPVGRFVKQYYCSPCLNVWKSEDGDGKCNRCGHDGECVKMWRIFNE